MNDNCVGKQRLSFWQMIRIYIRHRRVYLHLYFRAEDNSILPLITGEVANPETLKKLGLTNDS